MVRIPFDSMVKVFVYTSLLASKGRKNIILSNPHILPLPVLVLALVLVEMAQG